MIPARKEERQFPSLFITEVFFLGSLSNDGHQKTEEIKLLT